MRAALVNDLGLVENVILLDEDSDYTPPKGLRIIIPDAKDTVSPGDSWVKGVWFPLVREAPEVGEVPVSVEAQLEELRATIDMLLLKSLEG